MHIRLAFIGFRHGHIFDLYRRACAMDEIDVVAACEEDDAARKAAASQVEITHHDVDAMLATVACDAVAVGDYYARRGSWLIKALEHNKHVISDKPMCTDMDELDKIAALVEEKGLKVGCMLDMRDAAPFIGLRSLVRRGYIGEIHAIAFGGQHPLLVGTRPSWYFEPGKHGGTINDIAIHAVDVIPWITGLSFTRVNAARCWNALATDFPHFEDAAQMMLTLENGCGVLGDVSYLAPGQVGYTLPFYWRMTLWGDRGVLEASMRADKITAVRTAEGTLQSLPLPESNPGGYLRAFLQDLAGTSEPGMLDTAQVLRAARVALSIQRAADRHQTNVSIDS
jgi:predicted dehydrogenase